MTELGICIVLSFIPLLAVAVNVPFEDCGSSYYLESITVSECTSFPCQLKIGSSVDVTINLLIQGTNFNSTELEQRVYFVVSKILLEVQVSPDPCGAVQRLNQSCNLRIGERVAYKGTLTVQAVPPLPATLYWIIRNKKTGVQVVCYKTTVSLINAS